jgi:hypothetical protein
VSWVSHLVAVNIIIENGGGSRFSSSSDGILVLSVTVSLQLRFKVMVSSALKMNAEGKLSNASILVSPTQFNVAG